LVKAEPPTDADIAAVVQTISRRVMRTLSTLGSLEAGTDARRPPWGWSLALQRVAIQRGICG
jgi:hypothetical protein